MQNSRQLRYFLVALALASAACLRTAQAEDWLTFGKTVQRQGYNGQEAVLNEQTVPGLHKLWSYPMHGPILTQPLVATGIPLYQGTGIKIPTDLVYVADLTGLVAAFDAAGRGMYWATQLPALPTTCDDFPLGKVGVVGTPTIDKPNNRMWVMAANGTLWGLALDSGKPLPGYPLQVIDAGDANGITINYGGLTYDNNGALYVTTAGQCDVPPYFGSLVRVSVGTTANAAPQLYAGWYPTLATGAYGGGIWGFGGVSLEPDGSAVYAATGNALTVPENIGYADQIVKLNPNLQPIAASRPEPDGDDIDFGATPLLYQPPGCPPQLAAMNKTGDLFVYTRARGGINDGPTQRIAVTQTEASGGFIGLPAYDPVYNHVYLSNPKTDATGKYPHGLLAFQVMGDCTLSLAWQATLGFDITQVPDNPAIPPMIANSIVYYSTGSSSTIYAYSPLGRILWYSGLDVRGGIFAPPTIVNGKLFVADYNGNLTAFGP